jgi:hypothetical protein
MINSLVDDLGELLAQLRAGGVEMLRGPESHENGKFAWILDPDGNEVELGNRRTGTRRTKPPRARTRRGRRIP